MSDEFEIKRKLTAILSADAVSYSRLMSENEDRTLRLLAEHRRVVDAIIHSHDGRIVNTAGDSILAEFSSSVEAVRCAIEMQEALKTANDAQPPDRRMRFRIGVNLGDVMISGSDLLGDGVNVAARLQGIAEPGGICISSSVYDQISGKIDLGFADLGEKSLKNITRRIHVYQLAGTNAPLKPEPRPALAGPNRAFGWILAGVVIVALAAVLAWHFLYPPPHPEQTAAEVPTKAEPTPATAKAEAPAMVGSQHWIGTLHCQPYLGVREARIRLPVKLKNGEFTFEKGVTGKPGYVYVVGKPVDGKLEMLGNFISKRHLGKLGRAQFGGSFDGSGYPLQGHLGGRPCSLTLRARE